MSDDASFSLEGYLERIGFEGDLRPSLEVLQELQARHLDSIPFENIDVRLGRPIALDLGALQAKLVRRRRGGYCFEQNTLFAAVLRAIGFEVSTLEARVRPPGATATLPRTHMTLAVTLDGGRFLADVGFGGDGPVRPVPFDGGLSDQAGGSFRLEQEARGPWVLRRHWRDAWSDLYAFSPRPALPIDFVVANHFTSTYPTSIFVKTLTVQRSLAEEKRILRGRSYTVRRGDAEEQREIDDETLPGLLASGFDLELTEDEVRNLVAATRAA